MITIQRNPNFTKWFDIRIFGKLVDNTKSQAKALRVAKQIQSENSHLQIVNKEESK